MGLSDCVVRSGLAGHVGVLRRVSYAACAARRSPPSMKRPLGFPRQFRVVRKADFARAYKEGRRARGALLLVVGAPNGLPHARLGLSVGKRIWRGAVQRNRVRRIFREAFRLSVPELPAGLDLVLVPAAPALEPGLEATRQELVRLAHQVARRLAEGGPRREQVAESES
jgi:ribonuclease P protein component